MEQLIRRRHCLLPLLLLLLLAVFLSAAVGGTHGVDAPAGGGQGIVGTGQTSYTVPTVRKVGGGHGGHGGHGHGHGNGGSEGGRGMPEAPPVFNPRTVGGNGNLHRGRSAAVTDLSRSSTCVLLAVVATIPLIHL